MSNIAAPADEKNEFVFGYSAIAQILFGDFEQIDRVKQFVKFGGLPLVRRGGVCARKSAIFAWVAAQTPDGIYFRELRSIRNQKGKIASIGKNLKPR